MKIFSVTLLLLSATFLHAATPTWQWIDGNGRNVFSDRAPPPEIPANKIVKRPAGMDAASEPRYGVPTATPEPKEATPVAAAANVAPAGVDKELQIRKQKQENEEKLKRKAEEERIAQAQAENCKRARDAKATYDSGVRISRTNAAGEREVLDDAARNAEIKRLLEVIASDCK
jgi:type IV secretory pathway VirB10-like protein